MGRRSPEPGWAPRPPASRPRASGSGPGQERPGCAGRPPRNPGTSSRTPHGSRGPDRNVLGRPTGAPPRRQRDCRKGPAAALEGRAWPGRQRKPGLDRHPAESGESADPSVVSGWIPVKTAHPSITRSGGRAINGGREPVRCRASPRRITPASSGAGSPATSPTCHGRLQACGSPSRARTRPGDGPEAPGTRQNPEYRGTSTRRSVIAATVRIGACHRRRSIPPGCQQSAGPRISEDPPTAPQNPPPFPRRWCP